MSVLKVDDLPFNVTDLRPQVDAQLVTVTPEIAEGWLARNTHNRRIRPKVVAQYARDMAAGNWQVTGEAIKFAHDGRLLDGQHRLHAVVDSGRAVTMLVITGIDNAAQDVMDTGSRRLAADMLTLGGHSNAALLAASTKWAALYAEGRLYSDRATRDVTHANIRDFIAIYPDIEEAVTFASSLRKHIDLQPAILGASVWIIRQIDAEAADEFFCRLADGIGLPAGSPILALRNRLRQIKKNRTRVEPEVFLSLVIRAWNAWRAGRSLSNLPTHTGGKAIRAPKAV